MRSVWEGLRRLMRLQIGAAPGADRAKEIARKAIKLELVIGGAATRIGLGDTQCIPLWALRTAGNGASRPLPRVRAKVP